MFVHALEEDTRVPEEEQPSRQHILGRPITSVAMDDIAGLVIGQEVYLYHLGSPLSTDASLATLTLDLYALLERKYADLFQMTRMNNSVIQLPDHFLWSRSVYYGPPGIKIFFWFRSIEVVLTIGVVRTYVADEACQTCPSLTTGQNPFEAIGQETIVSG